MAGVAHRLFSRNGPDNAWPSQPPERRNDCKLRGRRRASYSGGGGPADGVRTFTPSPARCPSAAPRPNRAASRPCKNARNLFCRTEGTRAPGTAGRTNKRTLKGRRSERGKYDRRANKKQPSWPGRRASAADPSLAAVAAATSSSRTTQRPPGRMSVSRVGAGNWGWSRTRPHRAEEMPARPPSPGPAAAASRQESARPKPQGAPRSRNQTQGEDGAKAPPPGSGFALSNQTAPSSGWRLCWRHRAAHHPSGRDFRVCACVRARV